MKFTFLLAVLAVFVAVEAAPAETNAQRLARGLPPLYPQNLKRGTPVAAAKRNEPSYAKRGNAAEAAKRGQPSGY